MGRHEPQALGASHGLRLLFGAKLYAHPLLICSSVRRDLRMFLSLHDFIDGKFGATTFKALLPPPPCRKASRHSLALCPPELSGRDVEHLTEMTRQVALVGEPHGRRNLRQ